MAARLSRRAVARYAASQLAEGALSRDQLVRQLVAYLAETHQLAQAELLIRDIELVLAQDYGHVSIAVTSAHELSEQVRATIQQDIAQRTGAQTTSMTSVTIDPSLIAGVIVQTPMSTFDSTVKTRLKQLRSIA